MISDALITLVGWIQHPQDLIRLEVLFQCILDAWARSRVVVVLLSRLPLVVVVRFVVWCFRVKKMVEGA